MIKLFSYIVILLNLFNQIYCDCVVQNSVLKHIKCSGDTFLTINGVADKEMYEILTIENPSEKTIASNGILYPSLIELELINITKINRNAFENLEQLEKLIIMDSPGLTKLNSYALKNFVAEHLTINGTGLETIEVGTFDDNNLLELDLSNNRFTTLEEGLFDSLSTLEVLNLRSNNIQELPPNIFTFLDHLERLDLSFNQLTNLPSELFQIEDNVLEEINLSHNNIQQISDNLFQGLSSLKILNLSSNKLKSINIKSFVELNKLQSLDLSGNNFEPKVTDEDFKIIPSLNNLILELSPTMTNPPSLESPVTETVVKTTAEAMFRTIADPQTPRPEINTEESDVNKISPMLESTPQRTTPTIISTSTIPTSTIISSSTIPTPTVISTSTTLPIEGRVGGNSSEDVSELVNLIKTLERILNITSGNGLQQDNSQFDTITLFKTLAAYSKNNPLVSLKEAVSSQSHKINPLRFEHHFVQNGSDISIIPPKEAENEYPTIHVQQTSKQKQKIIQNQDNIPFNFGQIVGFLNSLTKK